MSTKASILVVDDEEMMREFIVDSLSSSGYSMHQASDIHEAGSIAADNAVDLLITDIRMSRGSGFDLIRTFRLEHPCVAVVVVTGYPGTEQIELTEELEVASFLTKPFSPQQLRYSVMMGLEKRRRMLEEFAGHEQTDSENDLGLVGTSRYMNDLRREILAVAGAEFPVLIQGPSGTGKEIVANAIHSHSSRAGNPIVTINCAAIPGHLEESEFFGHVKGAFTGASATKNGIVAAADKSSLFLDEVAELSAGVQAKLLRVLENGEFLRVGDTDPHRADIRVIAATNRNLMTMVEQGLFRKDLYFRLKGVVIETRSLAEHREDIPQLVTFMLRSSTDSNSPGGITSKAMAFLANHDWPGNTRELKQMVRLLCHGCAGRKRINVVDVESVLKVECAPGDNDDPYMMNKEKILGEFERDFFARLLRKYSGNLSQSSKAAGMHRPNLIKKLKALRICADDYRVRRREATLHTVAGKRHLSPGA